MANLVFKSQGTSEHVMLQHGSNFQLFISPQSQLMFKFWLLFSTFNEPRKKVRNKQTKSYSMWTLFGLLSPSRPHHHTVSAEAEKNTQGFILWFLFSRPPHEILFSIMMSYHGEAYQTTQTINFIFVIIISGEYVSERERKAWEKFECIKKFLSMDNENVCLNFEVNACGGVEKWGWLLVALTWAIFHFIFALWTLKIQY